jgi:hypothetical protein
MSDSVERYPTATYRLGEVLYVPHYRNSSIFVGPGYPKRDNRTYTVFALEDAGAVKETRMLWSRGLFGEVTTANP